MRKFPQKLKFREESNFSLINEEDMAKVTLIHSCDPKYLETTYVKVMSTWIDKPIDLNSNLPDREELRKVFVDVLSYRTLPNSLESLTFTFLVENLSVVEVTHLLRHRSFSGIHAQCSADRDLRDENFYYPESIKNSPFYKKYVELMRQANELYTEMVDSGDVSIIDARYVLPRAGTYFYYFTANLKDLIGFIKQRRCTQIQPDVDNILAQRIYDIICDKVPEVEEVLQDKCDESCYYVNAPDEFNTRLHQPDLHHLHLLQNKHRPIPESIYNKTKGEFKL